MGVLLVYAVCVIYNADDAVGVGHTVHIVRVIVQAMEALIDVLVVRDVVKVQRQEHVVFAHAGYHVIRRYDDIEAHSARGELCEHVLIAGVGGVVHLDLDAVGLVIIFLEGLYGVKSIVGAVGDVLAPVVDVQRQGVAAGEDDNRDHADEQRTADDARDNAVSTGALAPFLRGLGFGGLCGLGLVAVNEVRHNEQREDNKEDDRRKSVHLRRDGLFRHVIDADRQCLEAVAGGEIADDEVVQREGEGHDEAGHDAGHDLGYLGLHKRAQRRTAEIHRCFGQRAVHLLELRQHL